MKAGVRISPRAIAIMPVRAAPSVAERVKVSPDIGGAPSAATATGTDAIAITNRRQ
jgi:hypothetical protein